MARFRVLAWRDIPTQLEATDDTGAVVKRPMPPWFMQEVSRITMREELAGTDDYLAAFAWSEPVERDGAAADVAESVAAELCERFGRTPDGRRMHRTRRDDTDEAGIPV